MRSIVIEKIQKLIALNEKGKKGRKMKWLHISDIHFKEMGYSTEVLRNAILKEIEKVAPKLDFILITGDCFYQNCAPAETISELTNFIQEIKRICGLANRNRVFLCVGNHDVDRKNDNRNNLIDELRKTGGSSFNKIESILNEGYNNYNWFYNRLTKNKPKNYDLIEPRNTDFRIISVNSCLLSKDNNDFGQLRVCTSGLTEYSGKIKNDRKLNLLIMHHSLDWLQSDDARSFEHWAEDNNIDVIFSGHTHIAAVNMLNDVNREIYQFTAGALKIDDHAVPSFYLCELDNDILTLSLYTFSNKTEGWSLDTQHLRKFEKDGKHSFKLCRLSELSSAEEKAVVKKA